MSSQNFMNAAIFTRLAGTAGTPIAALGSAWASVYFEQAPDNATMPYVVWLYPSEIDQNLTPTRMKDIVLRVYGVANAPALAGTIDAQIDTLLNEAELSFAGSPGTSWTNIWLRRENGYQLVTTSEAGLRYYTSGADYRVEITK